MGYGKVKILKDIPLNIFSGNSYQISYIVEATPWVVQEGGRRIASYFNRSGLLRARTSTSSFGIRNQIIHFRSLHTFLKHSGFVKPHRSNRIVSSIFHIVPEDKRLRYLPEMAEYADVIHTAAASTQKELVERGVPRDRITVIPLGVELSLFHPCSLQEKERKKRQNKIPFDRIVIGSFQKDGVGWGEGKEPKLIKGPDIFVQTVARLARRYPVFVLLVGPARGYVKRRLEDFSIPYAHIGFVDFHELPHYYSMLDMYMITSRIEGGPLQILEAWACGVPVVSTKVGMILDIAKNNENIALAEVDNVDQLIQCAESIVEDQALQEKFVVNGLREVQNYSWAKIAERYYQEMYASLI